jgi:glycerol kinase
MGTTNTKKPQSNILDTLNWQEEVVESMSIHYKIYYLYLMVPNNLRDTEVPIKMIRGKQNQAMISQSGRHNCPMAQQLELS